MTSRHCSVEIVELLDSDSEAEQAPPKAVAPSTSFAPEFIDLCQSDEEITSKDPPQFTKRRKVSLSAQKPIVKSSLAALTRTDSSDSDDSLLHKPIVFTKKRPASIAPKSAPLIRKRNDLGENHLISVPPALSSTALSVAAGTTGNPKTYNEPGNRNTLLRKSPPQNSVQPFSYPTLLRTSKQYPDERARLALGFWKFGRSQTARSHQRPNLDAAAKRVVKLALLQHPLRSLEEYATGGNVSKNTTNQTLGALRTDLDAGGYGLVQTPVTTRSPNRNYYTICEACLVALLSHVETVLKNRGENLCINSKELPESLQGDKTLWMPLEELIPAVDRLLRPECPGKLTRSNEHDNGAAHYLQQSTRSMEFLQIVKLMSPLFGPQIKKHTYNKQCCFELLPQGYKTASHFCTRTFPEPPGHYRSSPIATYSELPKEYQYVCLGVDLREGGGGSRGVLHQMCNKLNLQRTPYFVGSLSIGDYVFFTTKDGGKTPGKLDYLCPILIERKSVEDVAQSIHDGRWQNQKRRMYHGQYIFGYGNSRMVYIIEGNRKAQSVTGGYVGARWFNVDQEKYDREIENLKAEGFEVLLTPSRENTMFQLCRWAKQIAKELKEGKLRVEYTYEQFKAETSKIGKNVDFSRLAKDYMQQKQASATFASPASFASSVPTSARCASESFDSNVKVLPSPSAAVIQNPYSSSKKIGKAAKMRAPSSSSAEKEKNGQDDKYTGKSNKELQEACKSVGLPKTGNRADLIARLDGPRPPQVWLQRKRAGEFVPERHNVAGSALLVALYLHERDNGTSGVGKDELYVKAEGLNITKNPFSGGTTQTGPFLYDGWSSMPRLLKGDPALVIKKNNVFKLTRSCDIAGYEVAKAIHKWNHEHGNCSCGEF